MKFVDWSEDAYGEGEIVVTCDSCHKEDRSETFSDNDPDYKAFQTALFRKGWLSTRVNYKWRDFCCEKCRNDFIKRYGG